MFDILQDGGALSTILFAFVLASIVALVYMAIMVRRTEMKAEQRLKQARADITDMTILFQTMRDIIGQQKSLAKDFNEELEHKMGQVKHILNQGMEKNKQLYDKQQRIVAELEEAQAQIDGLFRQITHIQKAVPAVTPPNSSISPGAPRTVGSPAQATNRTEAIQRTPSSVVIRTPASDIRDLPAAPKAPAPRPESGLPPRTPAKPAAPPALTPAEEARLADTGVTRAPFTSWIAQDLLSSQHGAAPPQTGASPKPPLSSAPTPAPVRRPAGPEPEEESLEDRGPSNGDAAREAFRALLNMPMSSAPPSLDMPGQARDMTAALGGAPAPLESPLSAPLQQRVLEYSEAGMTVAEVSRELGIGKGEVRLMLSLARQASPPL